MSCTIHKPRVRIRWALLSLQHLFEYIVPDKRCPELHLPDVHPTRHRLAGQVKSGDQIAHHRSIHAPALESRPTTSGFDERSPISGLRDRTRWIRRPKLTERCHKREHGLRVVLTPLAVCPTTHAKLTTSAAGIRHVPELKA